MSTDDKPRVSGCAINTALGLLSSMVYGGEKHTDTSLTALADGLKALGALRMDLADAIDRGDDAIAHAGDFGAEVDQMRGTLDNEIHEGMKWHDKYNALREAVAKYDNASAEGTEGEEAEAWSELIDLLKDDEGGGSSAAPEPVSQRASTGIDRPAPSSGYCPTCNGTGSLAEGTRDQMGCAECDGKGLSPSGETDSQGEMEER